MHDENLQLKNEEKIQDLQDKLNYLVDKFSANKKVNEVNTTETLKNKNHNL